MVTKILNAGFYLVSIVIVMSIVMIYIQPEYLSYTKTAESTPTVGDIEKGFDYGVGMTLSIRDGSALIVYIVPGEALDKDGGIYIGDEIIAIGKASGGLIDVSDLSSSEILRLSRGTKDSILWFMVKRNGHYFSSVKLRRTFKIPTNKVYNGLED